MTESAQSRQREDTSAERTLGGATAGSVIQPSRDVSTGDFNEKSNEKSNESSPRPAVDETIYIGFDDIDACDPVELSRARRWGITLTACLFTCMAASASSTYSPGIPSMVQDLHCTEFQANIGLSMYPLGFGVVPLVTASFSEEFGRQPLYIASTIGFTLANVMIALAPNIQTAVIGRFFVGAFGSTGATMVGGTVADIWLPHERGLPMSIFTFAVIFSTAVGPIVAGWIEMNPHMQWRWIAWMHVIAIGSFIILFPIFMQETRASVLLERAARKMRKETGDNRYRARVEDERPPLRTLIYISCTRPLRLLCTEPVVFSFSLWLAFTWGILYCMIESVGPIFKNLHGFSAGQAGTVFVGATIGVCLGFATDYYQEIRYQKNFHKRGPEARLYAACGAAFLLPIGMFIYAWTSFSYVHWIGPIFGILVFFWALFIIFLVAFIYLADCYGPYASSALAGQSLFRNLMAVAFPLFTAQMFDRLTYPWASTLFAFIAVAMIPIPYVLFFFGPTIRARSKFSSAVTHRQP